jgi:hypothetical protein
MRPRAVRRQGRNGVLRQADRGMTDICDRRESRWKMAQEAISTWSQPMLQVSTTLLQPLRSYLLRKD